jgi:hypothetical protein
MVDVFSLERIRESVAALHCRKILLSSWLACLAPDHPILLPLAWSEMWTVLVAKLDAAIEGNISGFCKNETEIQQRAR